MKFANRRANQPHPNVEGDVAAAASAVGGGDSQGLKMINGLAVDINLGHVRITARISDRITVHPPIMTAGIAVVGDTWPVNVAQKHRIYEISDSRIQDIAQEGHPGIDGMRITLWITCS